MSQKLQAWAAEVFGHSFTDENKLREAVTHPSRSGRPSYQRLEFLGDRVLGLIVAQQLLARFSSESEGVIARRFVKLVRKETLADVARKVGVPDMIDVEASARQAGIHRQDGVCADVMEALMGALYLDGGLAPVEAFIASQWEAMMASETGAKRDPKTTLQEWAQGRGLALPAYTITGRSGPDHAPQFSVEVAVEGFAPVKAEAGSKKLAEKAAAQAMWAHITSGLSTQDD
ncbi:MAG: ribonuclease III [Pseudomonadota bacterium]